MPPQVLTELSPKVAFFVASVVIAIMGITMITIDLIVMAGYTSLAAKVLKLLKSPKQQKYLNRTFAVLFAGAARLLSLVHQ